MENIFLILLIYFIAMTLSGRSKKRPKGRPGRVPESPGEGAPPRREIEFEIPRREGAPPSPSTEAEMPWEEAWDEGEDGPASEAEGEAGSRHEGLWAEAQQQDASEAHASARVPPKGPKEGHSSLRLTPQSALQAIAMAEILGRPKAYRNIRKR